MTGGRLLISSSYVFLKKHTDPAFIAIIKAGNRTDLVL
jgi:hypothetical protein